jgi:hypothetical protein
LLAQAAASTYTPQNLLAFGDHTTTTGEENGSLIFPYHRQEFAISDYFELMDYTDFPLADFGDMMIPLPIPQQLETTTWPPVYMNPTPSVPLLTSSDNSISSPVSLGITADNLSLDLSDTPSPWELGNAWDLSL